jgi:hypothetical protein
MTILYWKWKGSDDVGMWCIWRYGCGLCAAFIYRNEYHKHVPYPSMKAELLIAKKAVAVEDETAVARVNLLSMGMSRALFSNSPSSG